MRKSTCIFPFPFPACLLSLLFPSSCPFLYSLFSFPFPSHPVFPFHFSRFSSPFLFNLLLFYFPPSSFLSLFSFPVLFPLPLPPFLFSLFSFPLLFPFIFSLISEWSDIGLSPIWECSYTGLSPISECPDCGLSAELWQAHGAPLYASTVNANNTALGTFWRRIMQIRMCWELTLSAF